MQPKTTPNRRYASGLKYFYLFLILVISFQSNAQLTGTVTVDNTLPESSTNFTRIGTLMNALYTSGVGTGGLTVIFKDDQTFVHDYNSAGGMTDIFSLPATISGASNPLVFTRSGDGTKKPNIYLQSPGWEADGGRGFILNQTDYVTVDGFNFVSKGGPFNNNDSTSHIGAIWINNSNTDGCDHIAIVNNDFDMKGQNISDFCCSYGGVIVSNFNGNTASVPYISNSKISGNTFLNFKVAIRLWDVGATASNTGNEYAYNTFTGFSLMAIQAMSHENTLIHHNVISGMVANKGGADEREEIHAFFLQGNGNFQIYNNIIHGFTNTGSGALRAVKIHQPSTSVSTIYNNMIYDFKCPNSGYNPGLRLFEVENNGKYNFYYNSIYLENAGGTATGTAIIKSDHGNDKYNLKNNIMVNNSTGTEKVSIFWEDYSDVNVISSSSNNNLYYSNASNFGMIVNADASNIVGTFASYQASKESASHFEPVPFVSANDLHLQMGPTTSGINGGTSIAGITTDIDGDTRNASRPFIGADEFALSFVSLIITPQSNLLDKYRGKVEFDVVSVPVNPTNPTLIFTINPSGIVNLLPGNYLQAVMDGVVTVTATSVENSLATSSFVLTVTNQEITQFSITGGSMIKAKNDTLALRAAIASDDFEDVYLSDLDADSVTVGYGSLMKDLSTDSNPIILKGTIYAKGLGSHAPASMVYYLNGQYVNFKSIVGVDDECGGGTVTFSVYGDGVLLTQTPVIATGQTPYMLDLSVAGVQRLKLVVGDGGDGYSCDHAVWANAKMTRKANFDISSLMDWTLDNPLLASVAGTGTVRAFSDGVVVVKAALKTNPLVFVTKTITIAGAELLAYEGFEYSNGPFNTNNGGYGWAAGWDVQNGSAGYATVNSDLLTVGGLIIKGGYAIGGDAYNAAGRKLDVGGAFSSYASSGNIGTVGKTLYTSMLMRADVDSDNEKSIQFHDGGTPWATSVQSFGAGYFGASSNDNGTRYWSLKIGSAVYTTTSPVVVGEEVLIVLKAQFDATNSTLSGFINPVPGAPEPTLPDLVISTTNNLAFKSVCYYGANSTGQSSIDEIRLGSTFGSVTPTLPTPQVINIQSRRGHAITTDADTLTLNVEVLPNNTPDKTVTWMVSDVNLATISGSGLLKSIGNGVVTVTATSVANSSLNGTFVLSISGQFVAVVSVSISGAHTISVSGGSSQLTATISPVDATDASITWTIDNTNVATVSGSGLVQALTNGVVTLTATSISNPLASFMYEILISGQTIAVVSVSVSGTNLIEVSGGTSQLSALVLPANATNASVTWSSSDASLATVSGTGLVQGIANGVVTITATSVAAPSIVGSIEITLSNQGSVITVPGTTLPGGNTNPGNNLVVSITGSSNTIDILGGTLQLTANVSGGTVLGISWTVSDTLLASVSATGLLTAIADGIVMVRATATNDPAVFAEYTVTISNQTTGILQGSNVAVKVYPNPASDVLNISTSARIIAVKLINTIGTVVFEGSSDTINVKDLPEGLYLLYLSTDKGNKTERIIKKQ